MNKPVMHVSVELQPEKARQKANSNASWKFGE